MFDLRYHVASLAAVFLALVIGILVGVGISSGGFVSKGERSLLNREIEELQRSLDAARARTGDLSRAQRAAATYVEESYPLLMADRLARRRVALVFVGPVDAGVRDLVERTLVDAGAGATLRMRALRVPVDTEVLGGLLDGRPALARYRRPDAARDLGSASRRSSSAVGGPPSGACFRRSWWRNARGTRACRLTPSSSRARSPRNKARRHGCFVASTRGWRRAACLRWASRPHGRATTAVDAFDKASLSSVDFVDTEVGRLALALLLAGGGPGATASSRRRQTASCPRSRLSPPRPIPASSEHGTDDPHRGAR